MPLVDSYINAVIAPSVASECAELDAFDARKVQEQIKIRPGRYESIEGFYVDSSCGPMGLDYFSAKNSNSFKPKVLVYSYALDNSRKMTIFTNEKKAQQLLRLNQEIIKKNNYIPDNNYRVRSTGTGNNVYHFFDDDSKVWLPSSALIDICDELPEPFWKTLGQLEKSEYGWYPKGVFK